MKPLTTIAAIFVLPASAQVIASTMSAAVEPPRPPNIVHVVLDDWGYYEMSGLGHPTLKTPNIDGLAAAGTRFTQCLAGGPVCAPTRCALMTGKHAGHMTVRANGGSDAIRAGEETIASMFKRAGYATGGFGKWGLGARGTSGIPEQHGFDLFFGYYDQLHAHTYYPRYLVRNSGEVPLPGNTGNPYPPDGTGNFSQYRIFEEATRFVETNKNRPFYIYLPWTPPHGLWGFPQTDPAWQLFKDKPWTQGQQSRNDAKAYAAMLSLADRELGELLAQLKRLGIADNTIVVLSGDNGGQPYFNDKTYPDGIFSPNVNPRNPQERFRGGKGCLYEGGLRIPFIVCWPGRIAAGRVSDHLCYFPDVMPTLAGLAGVKGADGLDGISFAPTLLGEITAQKTHPYLYWEFGNETAVRIGQWKAHRNNPKADWELYDLASDISENRNVAADHPDIVTKVAAYASQAHAPQVPGEVLDKALAGKDALYEPIKKP